MVGMTISHYRVISKLGEGGMGVVYLAEDIHLGRRVAIKTAKCKADDYAFLNRFLREAQAASNLSHQHIATIYDYGKTEDGKPYIVMELVEGQTLSEVVSSGALTISETLKIVKQVAEALSEAHRHGIVHRDIKPSNIAITDRGIVKVLDFGLAKHINGDQFDQSDPEGLRKLVTQTREGTIVGTPMYFSPEQALGLPVDQRSDLFSLGSVLYECIAGQPAFPGSSPNEISAKVIRDDPPAPSNLNSLVPPALDHIALKSLAKKLEDRYQSTEELMADMAALGGDTNAPADTLPSQRKAPTTTERSLSDQPSTHGSREVISTDTRSYSKRLLIILTAIFILIAGTVFLWQSRKKSHRPSVAAQRLFDDAVEEMHRGVFFRASRMLQQLIQDDDNFALAHARLAEAYAELDYSQQAVEELLRVRELVPNPDDLSEIDKLRLEAVTGMVKRDFNKAITNYQALVRVSPDAEKQHAFIDLGRAFEKNDQSAKAIEAYEQARNLDPRSAAAFLRLGVIYGRSQKVNDAFASFDQSYKLFDTTGVIEGLAEVSLQRAVLLGQLGRTAEARDELNKALDKFTTAENQDKRIRVLLNLSNNYLVTGQADQGQAYSSEAVTLARQNKMETLTIQGIIDIGNTYFIKSQYTEAENKYKEAIQLAQLYKADRNEARAYLMLASLRNHQNDPDAARDLVQKALPFYEKGGYRKELSQAYSILGHAQDQAGDYEKALRAFQQQLEVTNQVGDPLQSAYSHEGAGVVLNHQQRYPEALDQFNKQYEIVKSLNIAMLAGYSAMNRGTMLWQLGRYEEANSALNEATTIAEKNVNASKELLGWIRVSRARMALSRGDIGQAKTESQEAIKIAGTEMKAIAVQAMSTLGLAESESGNTASAKQRCQDAVVLAQTLRDPMPLSHALLALSQAALRAKDFEKAVAIAQQAQVRYASANQQEAEWRAWAIIARTKQIPEAADRATSILSQIEQRWGTENYQNYSKRSDVSELILQLKEISSAK